MSDLSLILVLQFKTSINRNKTWQRYKYNQKNSHLLEAFFQSWSNLTQFLEKEKYDAKPTYKKFLGYRPGVYVIGDFG